MKAIDIVNHKGKNIVTVNISNTTTEQLVKALLEAQTMISKLQANSALFLTDATNAAYNSETGAAIKEFAAKNTPFVKASAVVGADGMKTVLQTAVAMHTHRDIAAFPNRNEAMDWLVAK
jgi:hypothetical protein